MTPPSPSRTRIIAVEEHFSTPELFAQIEKLTVFPGEEPERDVMALFPQNPRMRARLADLSTRLKEMDDSGTDLSVLSANPPGPQLYNDVGRATALARDMNDTLVGIVKAHPRRFQGIGSIAPQDPDQAAQEVKRIMGPLGLGGVNINSHTNGHYLDEPAYEPILAALEEEGATLYLHPRVPGAQMFAPYKNYGMLGAVWGYQAEAGVHAVRLILSGVFDRHPKLKVVLGHSGEALPYWLWRLDNIYLKTVGWAAAKLGMPKLELKPSEYFHRNFAITVSGMYDQDVLDFCLRKLPAENVLFAIDYPYEDSATATHFLRQASLGEQQRTLISHRNAERLFRIPALVE
jgi:5-carboxyvanillate decarboxylase